MADRRVLRPAASHLSQFTFGPTGLMAAEPTSGRPLRLPAVVGRGAPGTAGSATTPGVTGPPRARFQWDARQPEPAAYPGAFLVLQIISSVNFANPS